MKLYKNFPFICRCGFNTMNQGEALKHTNEHARKAFAKVKEITEGYLGSYYPQAPDPIDCATAIENVLKEAELL